MPKRSTDSSPGKPWFSSNGPNKHEAELQPVSIEHRYDEVWDERGKSIDMIYNFLDYAFEEGPYRATARHYVDQTEVTLQTTAAPDPSYKDFIARVRRFLERRYRRVTVKPEPHRPA